MASKVPIIERTDTSSRPKHRGAKARGGLLLIEKTVWKESNRDYTWWTMRTTRRSPEPNEGHAVRTGEGRKRFTIVKDGVMKGE